MANDYIEFGRPHEAQWAEGIGEMNKRAAQLLRENKLPETFSQGFQNRAEPHERVKVYPEISLGEEHERQRQLIIPRVVASLGISEKEASLLLPKRFPKRPESFNDSNSIPVIVPKFSQFSWEEHVDAAKLGISDYLRSRLPELSEWEDPRGIMIPNKPYSAWLYVGDDYLKRKPQDVRVELSRDTQAQRRAGDHWEAFGVSTVREDVVRAKWFYLPGGQVGQGNVPYVLWWNDRPEFNAPLVGHASPSFRSLVCGSEIET